MWLSVILSWLSQEMSPHILPASGAGSARALAFFFPPSLQSLCVVVVSLWVTGRFCIQQSPEPSCDQGLSTCACEKPFCGPRNHAILAYLCIRSGVGFILLHETQTARGCAASLPTQGAFLGIFGEFQGVLSFISGDLICAGGMSSLHNKMIHHYPQKHNKPILSYKKCIKPMCFPGKSLLVVIGTGTRECKR